MTRPVIEQGGCERRFNAGLRSRLAGLRLQNVGDVLGVVEHPVLIHQQPMLATAWTEGLPFGLEKAQLAGLGCDVSGHLDRHSADDGSVRGVAHRDGRGFGLGLDCGHQGPLFRRVEIPRALQYPPDRPNCLQQLHLLGLRVDRFEELGAVVADVVDQRRHFPHADVTHVGRRGSRSSSTGVSGSSQRPSRVRAPPVASDRGSRRAPPARRW